MAKVCSSPLIQSFLSWVQVTPSTKLSLHCVIIFSWMFIVLLPPDHSQENKTWPLLSEPSRARVRRSICPPMSSLEQGHCRPAWRERGEEGWLGCGPPPPSHTGTSNHGMWDSQIHLFLRLRAHSQSYVQPDIDCSWLCDLEQVT